MPARSQVLGPLASDARLAVTVTLKPRDPAALASYATAVATPGSGVYHHYLSVPEFAQRFAPTPAQIAAVESWLRSHRLSPAPVSANGLAIRVTASAGLIAHAFSTSFERVVTPGAPPAFANTSAPALDANLASAVQAVLGLDSLAVVDALGVRAASRHARSGSSPHVVTGGPQPCAAASTAGATYGAYTADQLASAYSFSSLYGTAGLGAGQTVGIYELEANDPADIASYQSCYGTSASVSYVQVDGGVGQGSGTGEAALDIENVIGLAPGTNIIVYQAPRRTSANLYDNFAAIISADVAKVISTSWRVCEASLGSAAAGSENVLFQEAAIQGQSIFAAAGDKGSGDCSPTSQALAVADPASQPNVTSVGGTTLSAPGPPPTETVWNNAGGAGGGGISTFWPMPAYQSGAPASLNVVNAQSLGTPCHRMTGYCREVPDVSAAADQSAGYVAYYNSAWTAFGGTSGAAPLWAAFTALVNGWSACHGSPIGFANPALYRLAGSSRYPSAFNDITSGNNDFTGTHGGLFPAGPGYDMASGLGTPIAANLAAYLCGLSVVTVPNPGPQTSVAGAAVSLQLSGTSAAGAALRYSAIGLPAGLSIDASTGIVSGAPAAAGSPTVTVAATAADGSAGSTSFTWTVLASTVGVASPGNQAATVGVPVRAVQILASDNNGGALSYAATGLPAGLSIGASSGLISGTPTRAGGSTVTVTATDATGPATTTSFTWAIAAQAAFSHVSLSGVRKGRPKLSFTVAAAAGSPSIKTIVIRLPRGLSFSARRKRISRGIALTGPGRKRARFTAKLRHGQLTIKLRTAESSVKVTISHAELSESKSLKKRVDHRHLRSLAILLQATNSRNATIGAVEKLSV